MGWIVLIIVGGLVGWIASLIMKSDQQQGILLNVVVGIIGALLGRWFFGSVLGLESAYAAGTFSLAGLFWGIVGAAILIWLLRLLKIFR